MRIRRSNYLFVCIEDRVIPDLEALFENNTVRFNSQNEILALVVPSGQRAPITAAQLSLLGRIKGDWQDLSCLAGHSSADLDVLIAAGAVLVLPARSQKEQSILAHEELLTREQWHPEAALYHFLNKWEDFHIRVDEKLLSGYTLSGRDRPTADELAKERQETYRRFVEVVGLPPAEHHERPLTGELFKLGPSHKPDPLASSSLAEVLEARKTTRHFDPHTKVPIASFERLVRATFGMLGETRLFPGIVGIKKSSPSGGGLHPHEIYVLLMAVEGFKPGLYHYRPERHGLELLRHVELHNARGLANEFTSGQVYPRNAGALFIFATRFYRNHWKYRKHPRAFMVLGMDIAHLSQTFYLACAALRLGAFFTAAVNHHNIEKALGLDGYSEGVLGICGCGIPGAGPNYLDPVFEPIATEK